ncbi:MULTISPECIES: hypothetical protein [Paenibacillus]
MKNLFIGKVLATGVLTLSFLNMPHVSAADQVTIGNSPDGTTTGPAYSFTGKIDKEEPKGKPEITPNYTFTYWDMNALGPKYYNSKYLIRYLSDSWSNASSYTWTKTNTASLSFSTSVTADATDAIKAQFGLTAQVSQTYALGTTIPADSNKLSKLTFAADVYTQSINYQKQYQVCTTICSEIIYGPWEYTTYIEPTPQTYLLVSYK